MGDNAVESAKSKAYLKKIRGVCGKLPKSMEQLDKFGHTTFRFNDKPYIFVSEHDGEVSVSVKFTTTRQKEILRDKAFTKTPYIGRHGWVSIDAPRKMAWDEIRSLIEESYSLVSGDYDYKD